MRYLFSIAFSFSTFLCGFSASIPDHLIQHADSAQKSIQLNHQRLSKFLASGANTEEEKVLIFSYWIAKNIKYDLREVKDQHRTNKTAYEVLRNKKAVCEGYSILFQQFCENEGIEAYTVYGHGYGNLIRRSLNLYHLRHAWNAVYVSGEWQILDVTWAASEIKHGDFKKTHQFKWILTEPEEFSKTHYPNDPRWQLLKNPRSKKEFWNQSETISEKNYPIDDSLNILLSRERYLNEVAICASAYAEQHDEQTYIKNLIHLGWSYVGGSFDAVKVSQGIQIFSFADAELERLRLVLENIIYQPNIDKGLCTAEQRLQDKQ
ncbi:MAG: hypothetical protein IPH24_11580 [Crocinitomicaceae bacterium]|jgi:hypothetical protein|nr:hypothetical protein [Crocinitomicaceae bacterium]